ncbi:MAG: hypothetical protein NVSMB56_06700 [Pyrinomonadaceae bacterium]
MDNDATQTDAVVRFDAVSFTVSISQRPIINNLSFDVRRGETLVLLGESGCGKTTTLRLINKLLMPTSGEVFIENKSTKTWDTIELRRRTGYVIQDAGLFPHFTIARNVALVPSLQNWTEEKKSSRVEAMLELVGLDSQTFASRYPRELSGGQRQRVGFARALAASPPLLLLDEPFGALDPLTRAALQKEFVALRERLNTTSVFVTHDVREALMLGTRIGLMHEGDLVLLVTPEEFLHTGEPRARAYLDTLNGG